MTGAHFVTHVMLVAYAAIVPWVRDDFNLVTNTQMFSPITFTLFIYGVIAVGTGYLADRYEPLKMLTLGLVVSTIASFGIALSVNYWMLVICFSLLGAGLGFYHPVGLSYISKVFGPKHRGKALGINGIGGNSGWLISPIATAAIAVAFGWRTAYIVWGGLGLVFIALALYLFGTGTLLGNDKRRSQRGVDGEPGDGGQRNGKVDLDNLESEETTEPATAKEYTAGLARLLTFGAVLVMFITILRGFYFHGTTDTLPTFLFDEKGGLLVSEDASGKLVMAGGFLSVLYLMGIVAEPLGGWMKDRYQAGIPIFLCSLLNAGSIVLLIYAETTLHMLLFAATFGFAFLMLMAVVNALIADVAPPKVRGTFFGITFLTRDGICAFSPLFIGFIGDVTGTFENGYWVLAVIALITALLGLAVTRIKGPPME